jgi:hypothetical protein
VWAGFNFPPRKRGPSRNIVTFDIAATLDFEGDIFRDVLRPALGGVEGDDPDRVAELPRH